MIGPIWNWDPDRKAWRVRVELTLPQNLLCEEHMPEYFTKIDEFIDELKSKLKMVNSHGNTATSDENDYGRDWYDQTK